MTENTKSLISLKNVIIGFDKNRQLKLPDIVVSKGDFCYLSGPNGSGKSSVIKLILGQKKAKEGEVLVFDLNMSKANSEQLPLLRRNIGLVAFEYPLLNNLTLRQNFNLILKATDWNDKSICNIRIEELAAYFGIADILSSFPKEVPKTEIVKAMIVRALLNRPQVLILDDAFSLIDEDAADLIMNRLIEYIILNKTTLIFATNNSVYPKKYSGRVYRFQ